MISEATRRRRAEAKKAFIAFMKFYPLTLEDLDGEIWRPIDYCADYHISTFGRIKSFKNGKIRIMKPFLQGDYLYIDLCKFGVQKTFEIHILVAQTFIPNPENKPEVNHRDGCKFNCHVENLEWATHSENLRHAFANGLEEAKRGENNWQATMTNEQAHYVRENPEGLTGKELAEKFGVTPTVISNIQRGLIYKDAGGQIRESKVQRTPDEIRAKICAEYKRGVYGCGYQALAKKIRTFIEHGC